MSDNRRWSTLGERFIDVKPWDQLPGCFEEAAEEDHGVVDEQIAVVKEQIGTSNLTGPGGLWHYSHLFPLLCNDLVRSQGPFLS